MNEPDYNVMIPVALITIYLCGVLTGVIGLRVVDKDRSPVATHQELILPDAPSNLTVLTADEIDLFFKENDITE